MEPSNAEGGGGPGQVLDEHSYSTLRYKPLFVQRIENNLSLDGLMKEAKQLVQDLDLSDNNDL